MASRIKHKRSSVAGRIPLAADLEAGELALNTNDGKVYLKKDDNSVLDITSTIFKNDTNVTVTDTGADGTVSVTADNVEKLRINATQVQFKETTTIENAKELQFKELTGSGSNYVGVKAPDLLTANYTLTLPSGAGGVGQTLSSDGLGNLEWSDPDIFGGNRIYVSNSKGNDANDGITAPVQTLKRALQISSGYVYSSLGVVNNQKVVVVVSTGDYTEDNPLIVPDNVTVLGDSLRSCVIRPANANKDMLRVRNGCYFGEFTFRDGLSSGSPAYTFNYAVAFDDVLDTTTSRVGYTYLPSTTPIISQSPYIQNCSIISFLGGNGVLIDGNKVRTPNTPVDPLEVERPVSSPYPEQGKSMVANAFTMLSFGGTGWRIINNAYAQIVSCFQIFLLNGVYTQSGGYCSITNSATNFGLYALRASGYSPTAFAFDRGYIGTTGANGSVQTITAFGWDRPEGPVEEFVIRVYDPTTDADLTDSFKNTLPGFLEVSFNSATAVNVSTNIFTITTHGFNNGDAVIYNSNGGTDINGLFNGDTYFVKYINANQFTLTFDDSLTKDVDIFAVSTGTQKFKKQDYEIFVNDIIESHHTFQELIITGGPFVSFAPGAVIEGQSGGLPNNAYVYNWDSGTSTLTVSVNKVTIGVAAVRNVFLTGGEITKVGSTVVSYNITGTSALSNLYAATFEVAPTIVGGQLIDTANLAGKKIYFHRPSVTNSSGHTWEYAGSGTDYNALPQNGGQTVERYEQYGENAGRVYSSGTNELGDFKVGDFITAYNRTGNITFRNKVTVDTLDVLRLALSDIEITGISTDVDLGENEVGGPSNARLSTQLATWAYANNRLGSFIDKSVTTSAIPGSIVQLNSNGQINSDLIPTQRNFTSFISLGYRSRLAQVDNIPAGDMQSGDIATENFEQIELTLNSGLATSFIDGATVTQAVTGATGLLKGDYAAGATVIRVASVYGTFAVSFAVGATKTLTIAGTATAKYPTLLGTAEATSANYFLRGATSGQYLILPNSGSYTFTNATIGTAFRYNNIAYLKTSAAHNLVTGNQVNIDAGTATYDAIPFVTVLDSDEFYYSNTAADSATSASTTATATLAGATSALTMTGSVTSGALTGTIVVGNFVFDVAGTIPIGSKITTVNMAASPRTFTITFPASSTVASTATTQLKFFTPTAETGTVRSVITAADSLSQGTFSELRSGVLTNVNNLGLTGGTAYVPGIYLRVPLTNVSGSGTGALADITVNSTGAVTDVDLIFGGTGYASGNVLSASNTNLGGIGTGFQITATAAERRVYITISGGQLFVATPTAPDFAEDNNTSRFSITSTNSITKTFNAAPTGTGGNVDYATNYITISTHGLINGDPVIYDPGVNSTMGGLITLNCYYVKVVDANTIQLCATYNVASVAALALGPSSTGTHSLFRYSINLTDNSVLALAHGLVTGDAVRITGSNLFEIDSVAISDNDRFFVGSITTNSFTLHTLRADAILSIAGNVTNGSDITAKGTGTITFVANNVRINGTVNTSSNNILNWNSLVSTNIDATNIISGIIATTRLASGSASSDTFLRGDSIWSTAVKSVAVAAGSPITALGSGSGPYYGNVTLDVIKVDSATGTGGYSSTGAASFNVSQFAVGLGDSVSAGQVYIKNGVVDAGTLDTYDSSYFLNPNNLTSVVPPNKGGTGLFNYSAGDTIYATGPTTINLLNIGPADTVYTSTGSIPQWSPGLTLGKSISVTGAEVTTNSVSASSLFNTTTKALNIGGAASSVAIGTSSASESLTSNVKVYTTSGTPTTTVTVAMGPTMTISTVARSAGTSTITTTSNHGLTSGNTITVVATAPDATFNAINASVTVTGLTTFTYTNAGSNLATIAGTGSVFVGSWGVALAATVVSSGTSLTFASVTNIRTGQAVSGSASIPTGTTVIGISGTTVYLSDSLTNSITAGTAIIFTETVKSLGLKTGDQITIASSGVTNLDGTWPITGATINSSSFSITTDANVTATNVARAGTIVKVNTILLRNRTVTLGSSEASGTPIAAILKGENAVGTNISASNFTITPGLATGNGTSGSFIVATGATGSSGAANQSATSRLTIAANGQATFANDVVITSDLAVNGGDITTTATTFNLLNATAATVNAFGAATTLELGAATGTTNINNNLDVDGDVNIDGGDLTVSTSTFNLANTTATTINFGGAGTTIAVGAGTGTTTINHNAAITLDLAVNGGDITTTATTFNLINATATTVNFAQAGTAISIGATSGTTTVRNDLAVNGNTTLGDASGDTVTINAGTLTAPNTITFAVDDATTAGISYPVKIQHTTSGTPAAGIGSGLQFIAETSASTNKTGMQIEAVTTDVTVASEDFDYVLKLMQNGSAAAERFRVNSAGDGTLVGDLAVNGGDVTTTQTTFNLLNTTVTTGNLFGAGTSISIGAATGTTTINNANTVVTGDLAVNGGDVTTTQTTFNLLNTTVTTGNLFGAGTSISIGAATGTTTINNANTVVTGDLAVNGGDVTTTQTTGTVFNATATTVSVGGAATTLNLAHNTAAAQTVNLGTGSTGASTYNLGTGATAAATTKTVNVGTGGAASSTTNVNLGSATGGIVTANSVIRSGVGTGNRGIDFAVNDNYAGFRIIHNPTASGGNADGLYLGYSNGNSGATKLYGGGATTVSATVNANSTNSTSSSTGSVVVNGGLGVSSSVFTDGLVTINREAAINTTTPGTAQYGLHFQGQTTADYATGITFNGGTGTTGAQAGIYVQGSGGYGTRMYFGTTDSYAAGSKTRMTIQANGQVTMLAAIASTSTTTGTLAVTGGAGISGALFTGGGITNASGTVIRQRYDGSDNYAADLGWNFMQLGNNGDNFIIGGKTNVGGTLKFVVNQTNATAGGTNPTVNGTLALTLASGGTATFGSSTAVQVSIDTSDALDFTANSTNDDRGISFNGRAAVTADYNDGYLRLNNSSEFTAGVYIANYLGIASGANTAYRFTIGSSSDAKMVLSGSSNPYIRFQEGTTDKYYMQWNAALTAMTHVNQGGNCEYFDNSTTTNALILRTSGTNRGWFYADNGNNVGILDEGGTWAIKHVNDSHTEFYDAGESMFAIGVGGVTGDYGSVQTNGSGKNTWEGYSINGRAVFMHDGGNAWGIYDDVNNEWLIYGTGMGTTRYVELRYNNSVKLQTNNVGVEVTGLLTATTKSFLIDHPTKAGMKLQYACLEGPENGVYVRGKLEAEDVIELPEYWTGLVHSDSITVNLTPCGAGQQLYVDRIEDNKVYVVNETGKPVKCFYTVYGERKDVDNLTVEF